MRTIQFRAKREDNKEWVIDNSVLFFRTITKIYGKLNYWQEIEVITETVSQYTGLHDKNGKEIYEGDIVHCWDTIAKCEIWAVVEFGNPNAGYTWGWQLRKIKGSKGVNLDILCWVECEETNAYCEIIGNIYDNPELLKGE